ncbi:MAG: ribonuclease PH [Clostridia bacterium]|nr:ribonuclease PH [Clostridia bacterium]
MRIDGRAPEQARPIKIETNFVRTAAGSCLIATGNTRVICTASVEDSVPPFLKGKGQGWVTAEYAMLPASTGSRKKRDGIKKDGRSVEIQRLIGRSLRQAVDLTKLGERTITLDCDVLEADGGTRTASITGAMVALTLAVARLMNEGKLAQSPIIHQVAAVSVGVVGDVPCCDLCYAEDSQAQVDMNLVMNEKGEFIELQGTGEGRAFTTDELTTLLAYGKKGIEDLMAAQKEALGDAARFVCAKPSLVVASGNMHKIRELQHIFGDYYTVVPMTAAGFNGHIEENAATFAGNAAIKAETVCAATGLPTLADDSGLTVEALDDEPGVYSARYAAMNGEGSGDKDNNNLLLRRMKGKSPRRCAFQCAIALARPGHETLIAEGSCPGVLLEEERGEGGFGYDPLFLYEPLNKTFAEVNEEEKNAVSHRARACEKMLEIMKALHDGELNG